MALQKLGVDISVKATGASQVDKLAKSLERLQSVSLRGLSSKINSLENMMKPFQNMDASKGISKFANSLNKLSSVNLTNLAPNIQNMATALKPLTDEMIRGTGSAQAYATVLSKLSTKAITSGNAAKKASRSFNIFSGTMQRTIAALYVLSRIKNVLGGFVTEANNYIENLNLFAVAMGDYYDQAKAFAEQVGDKLGIDPSQWMRQQGIIMDMAKSFGVAEAQAYTMSKALTQIAYDFSSLYNLNIDDALKKVQSGLAGEIEPLRRIGKDLSVAKMQLVATELGLKANVQQMTQADKAMLRTIVLLRQSGSAMGDLARTINSPANQLRIFNAQVVQLKRALGYILLPTLQMILPYLIAMVKVLRILSEIVARLFNFEMPQFNYDSLQGNLALGASSTDTIADNMSSAAKDAKKINSYRAGFDELNVISKPEASTGGGGAGGAGGGIGGGSSILAEEMQRLTDAYDKVFLKGIDDKVTRIVGKMLEWLGIGELIVGKDGEMSIKLKEINSWTDLLFTRFGAIATLIGGSLILGTIGKIASMFMTGGAIFNGAKVFMNLGKAIWWVIEAIGVVIGIFGVLPVVIVAAVVAAVVLIIKYWDEIVVFFTETIPNWWNNTVIPFFSNMWENIKQFFKDGVDKIVTFFAELPSKLGYQLGLIIGKMVAWLENMINWVKTNVPLIITAVVNWFKELPQKILDSINKAKEKIIQWKDNLIKWFKEELPKVINSVIDWFKKLPENLVTIGKNMVKGLWNGIVGAGSWLWNKLKDFFGGIWTVVESFFGGVGEGVKAGYDSVPHYATGGMPEDGVFMANHSELVGQFTNGKTAVANNGQIVEGISAGVYEAVASAMSNFGGANNDRPFIIQLDGEVVYNSTRKVGARKGQQLVQAEYAR